MSVKKYYAVAIGRNTGIYETWAEAESQVKGVSGAKFKSFRNKEDAKAYIIETTKHQLINESKLCELQWREKNVIPYNRSIRHKHRRWG